ncbi:RNA ligase family protein [Pseudomonas monteilii]
MSEFFRFPHTPHLKWLAAGRPRNDKVLGELEAKHLLEQEVIVEEKIDGANIGIRLGVSGELLVQNRGQYILPPYIGQFSRLALWLAQHEKNLKAMLGSNQIIFGEWCAALHSLHYTKLPDWFLMFDVYDLKAKKFWSYNRCKELAVLMGIKQAACLYQGKTTIQRLERMVATESSRYGLVPLEGIIVRRNAGDWCEGRAKLVRPNFTQSIEEHWRKRPLVWNQVSWD